MLAILLVPILKARSLNVYAAASLKESFTALARRYEAANPGLTVRLNFAGSQTLASQINHGAPADVFASAALKNLNDVTYDKASFRVFVLNKLVIAVRKGLNVGSVAELSRIRNLVVADPAVPAGRYTESFFTKGAATYGAGWLQGIRSHIVSREADVKSVLAKVRLGEADAGIVYVSDVNSARGQVGEVSIPDRLNEIAEYPVAIPAYASNRDDAKHFVKFLLDRDSQRLFAQSGFISVTQPVSSISVIAGGREARLPLPLARRLPRATVQALDEGKRKQTFNGVLVSSLPGALKATRATFIGADRYVQSVSMAELRSRKAILVRNGDGNYQLIVPGLKPSVWVNWLRSIRFQ